jgi:hypothetical protein
VGEELEVNPDGGHTFNVWQLSGQPGDVRWVGEDVQIAGEQVHGHGDLCRVVNGWVWLEAILTLFQANIST